MPERIVGLAKEISELANEKLAQIHLITRTSKLLSMNALIEASRAGERGRGFAVVAREVNDISERIQKIAAELDTELSERGIKLNQLGSKLITQIRGTRLADLALNMIDIIDRNLYERSCDVRWWATDSAVVDCATNGIPQTRQFCSSRLGVILDSYTVYLDLWLMDLKGNVLANGRPNKYPKVAQFNAAQQPWFHDAVQTKDGTNFSVADIMRNAALNNQLVGTYATAVRAGGETRGRSIGVLAVFFDWQVQSQAVVNAVRLSPEEKDQTRCLILDSKYKVLASSDGKGILEETFPLDTTGQKIGNYSGKDGSVIGFALTPGYETYQGLGWYGVVAQNLLKK